MIASEAHSCIPKLVYMCMEMYFSWVRSLWLSALQASSSCWLAEKYSQHCLTRKWSQRHTIMTHWVAFKEWYSISNTGNWSIYCTGIWRMRGKDADAGWMRMKDADGYYDPLMDRQMPMHAPCIINCTVVVAVRAQTRPRHGKGARQGTARHDQARHTYII